MMVDYIGCSVGKSEVGDGYVKIILVKYWSQ